MNIILLSLIFIPMIVSGSIPINIERAQSVSTLLILTGNVSDGCYELEYEMNGGPYDLNTVLHVVPHLGTECIDKEFYVTTGFWWADYVCTPLECIGVTSP